MFWPFFRVLLMLLSLLAPPSLLSAGTCEGLLLFVDATGKWAMIDFVMLSLLIQHHMYMHFSDREL